MRKGVKVVELLKRLLVEEEGQTIVEYALVVALIAFVVIVAMRSAGIETGISSVWNKIASSLLK